ncbi:MAG TPA: CPBP family intramembrane glutamic endopeptidase [Blastocatellia bacterium]|nr:CPBP family intramembrane glutamic endopeptidase [Blastocatellia bacterium]
MSASFGSAKRVFINQKAELRCGWRIALFVICLILASMIVAGVLATINLLIPSLPLTVEPSDPQEYLSGRELTYLITSRAANLVATVVATAVCALLLEHRSFGSVGFKLHRGWLRDCLLGCVIGGASIALAVGMIKLGGAVAFEPATHLGAPIAQRSMFLAAAVAALLFLVAAAFEELLFRGFAFQALLHNIGPVAAVALTSVPFGIAHLANPSATAFSTINTILAGVWLGAAYLATRSLWLATALHFSWNFVMAFCFGLPVSGLVTVDRMALVYGRSGSPEWLSGGSYGPEGGVAATAVLIAVTLLIWRSRVFRPSDEMQLATAHGQSNHEPLRVTPSTEAQELINRTGENE